MPNQQDDFLRVLMAQLGKSLPAKSIGPVAQNAPKWYEQSDNKETVKKVDEAMLPNVRNTPWLEQMYKSGFADTLYQAGRGVPRSLGSADSKDMAAFVNPLGGLFMSPDRGKYGDTIGREGKESPDYTFAHEMGHLAPRPKGLPALKTSEPALWAMDERKGDPAYWKDNKPTPLAAALEKVDPYYRQNEDEAFSQAYANAVQFLREKDFTNAAERIGEIEAKTPGAGIIMRDLLGKPIYKNHPLKKLIR